MKDLKGICDKVCFQTKNLDMTTNMYVTYFWVIIVVNIYVTYFLVIIVTIFIYILVVSILVLGSLRFKFIIN